MAMSITDNRFETIERAKKDLLEATNIETSPDEMKVLNDFLYRCWQMGWLKQYEEGKTITEWIPVSERLPEENTWYIVTAVKDGKTRVGSLLYVNGFKNWKNVIAWMPLPEPYKGEQDE